MAGKIPELTLQSSPDFVNDLLETVDVSDTTDDATGTSKRLPLGTLFTNTYLTQPDITGTGLDVDSGLIQSAAFYDPFAPETALIVNNLAGSVRGYAPVRAAWTPASIASAKILQFHQVRAGNIFTDTGCTTAATTNGDTVKGVTARYGSGPNFTNSTGVTLQGVGAYPYLNHSGSTYLTSASNITVGTYIRYFVIYIASGTIGKVFSQGSNNYIFDTGSTHEVNRSATTLSMSAATGWVTTGANVCIKAKFGGNLISSSLWLNNKPISTNGNTGTQLGFVTRSDAMIVPDSSLNYAHRMFLWATFSWLTPTEEALMDAWIANEYGLTF